MSLVSDLSLNMSVYEKEVLYFLRNAPQKYKVYRIPKRTYGYRTIAHPSKELKKYQYAFLALFDLPYHPSAMAYVKNKSIKNNALAHKENSYLLKMDFKDFFNSITPSLFWNMVNQLSNDEAKIDSEIHKKSIGLLLSLSEIEKELINKILFWSKSRKADQDLILSIGAPSSPAISNMCMFAFDVFMNTYCAARDIVYTRYADDLFFSTNSQNILFEVPSMVDVALKEIYQKDIAVNTDKTVFASKASNRFITGITITNDDELSLGRKQKRYIRGLVHQFLMGYLDKRDTKYLNGFLAYAKHIEPKFIISLKNKYGHDVLNRIKDASYDK